VRHGVTHHAGHTGNATHGLLELLTQAALVLGEVHTHHQLTGAHGLRVLVILRTAGALGDGFHAVNLLDASHDLA
jgi:hypothetical protein